MTPKLARCLCLNVVAEGVETEDQLSLLKECRCNEVQGALFAMPFTQKIPLLVGGETLERVSGSQD